MDSAREFEEHLAKALKAAGSFGISKRQIEPIIVRLLHAFGGRWDQIELQNYRILINTYFDEDLRSLYNSPPDDGLAFSKHNLAQANEAKVKESNNRTRSDKAGDATNRTNHLNASDTSESAKTSGLRLNSKKLKKLEVFVNKVCNLPPDNSEEIVRSQTGIEVGEAGPLENEFTWGQNPHHQLGSP